VTNYKRISVGLNNYSLYPEDYNVFDLVKLGPDKDYYDSLYFYKKEHYDQFKKTKSLSGIRDVLSNRLVFDFDSKNNIEEARVDTITLVTRLLKDYGLNQDDFRIFFSGSKGFHVELKVNSDLERSEVENIVYGVGEGLDTLDKKITDQQRLIRVPLTKHQKTKLYKTPLDLGMLTDWSLEDIKEEAKSIVKQDHEYLGSWKSVDIPLNMMALKDIKKESLVVVDDNFKFEDRLELSRKPKWMSSAKFALQEGFFKGGERNNAFMILAATYKSHGFPDKIAWRMLKGVAEIQAKRNDVEEFSEKELWNNIIKAVYNPNWMGGTYSEKETELLKVTSERFNLQDDNESSRDLYNINQSISRFKVFAESFSKNRIKLGLDTLDDKVVITTGMCFGILGSPGAGKTTFANAFMKKTSMNNERVLFECLDMSENFQIARLVQNYVDFTFEEILSAIESGDITDDLSEAFDKVAEDFKNLSINYRSGTTIDDIENDIKTHAKIYGDYPRLVVVDYLEKVRGPYTDATANSGYIASRLSDLAREYNVCLLVLLQPQKSAGDASQELLSMRKVKGASVIEQDLRLILTMWRPGFSPKDPSNDKYASIAVVKNNMGATCKLDFMWDGLSGSLKDMSKEDKYNFDHFIKEKEEEKEKEDGNLFGSRY